MTRINRAYVKRLENLIVQLVSTFSDIETARAKGYLARDMPPPPQGGGRNPG
jgi:hypothetical protein